MGGHGILLPLCTAQVEALEFLYDRGDGLCKRGNVAIFNPDTYAYAVDQIAYPGVASMDHGDTRRCRLYRNA